METTKKSSELRSFEEELFKVIKTPLNYSNLTEEEWQEIQSVVDDRNIVIKKEDTGSYIVEWDRVDYLKKANKQLSDINAYKEVEFKEKMLNELVETSNKFFKNFQPRGWISEKNLKYFSYDFKKTSTLGKLYLLPKICKRLSDVPGRPAILNCGTPTEKVQEFLDFHLKPTMQNGNCYVRDSSHSLERIKNIHSIPDKAM